MTNPIYTNPAHWDQTRIDLICDRLAQVKTEMEYRVLDASAKDVESKYTGKYWFNIIFKK